MTRCEVDEFEEMIESALDAGRAAARVYRTIDEALAEWPLIDAFREGFSQESDSDDRAVLGVVPEVRGPGQKIQLQA